MCDLSKVGAVATLGVFVGEFEKLWFTYKSHVVGDFFDAANFCALSFLDDSDKRGGFIERLKSASIQPGNTPIEHADLQLSSCQIFVVDDR